MHAIETCRLNGECLYTDDKHENKNKNEQYIVHECGNIDMQSDISNRYIWNQTFLALTVHSTIPKYSLSESRPNINRFVMSRSN